MAVYKLFPSKDTFIYTEVPIGNAGYDEMLELGSYPLNEVGQAERVLIQFSTDEIINVVDNLIGNTPFSASINLDIASAYEIPTSHSIYAYPIYEYWDGGIGKYGDYPFDKSGTAWGYSLVGNQGSWTLPHNTVSMPAYVTGSYNSTYPGGGNWWTGSNGINVEAVQSFETNDSVDLDINVTAGVKLHYSGSIPNNGFILKFHDELEFSVSSSIRLKYYSANTNTIYPPSLDFKWDDSVYVTGSLSVLDTSIAEIELTNNTGEYSDIGKQRFRLLSRPKFPVRTFTTGSTYKTNYALPRESQWGLKDEFTEEMVIPFSDECTRVSCDANGAYFDVYMEGLQPERFYRVLIKTTIDGVTTVINRHNTFKIVRNG